MYNEEDDFLGKDSSFIQQLEEQVAKSEKRKSSKTEAAELHPHPVEVDELESPVVQEIEEEPLQYSVEEDDDFLSKDSSFIKELESKVTSEPYFQKMSNIPLRDGEERALDEKEFTVKILESGAKVEADIERAERGREEAAQVRYDKIIAEGKNLAFIAKFAWGVFMLLASILGIFVLINIIDFIEGLATLPPVLQWTFGAFMLLFSYIILRTLIKIYSCLTSFSQVCDIDLSTIQSLAQRDEYKNAAKKDFAKVKAYLISHLHSYEMSYMDQMGLDSDDMRSLKSFRNELIELHSAAITTQDWITQYQSLFETQLSKMAKKRVVRYAKNVAYSTAISPFPLLDRLIVLSLTLAMIKDVFSIYNLKLGKLDSMKLFALSISGVYLSGLAQEGANSLTENLVDSDFASQMGVDFLSSSVGKLVLSKVGEGSSNAFLVWRVGKFIIQRLNLK